MAVRLDVPPAETCSVIGYDRVLSGEVPREKLLARVRAAHPALLVLSAPAGYGKSTFARQATAGIEHVGIADCTGAEQATELAHSVLTGLADAFPERREEFRRPASILDDATIPGDEQLATLLSIWRQTLPPSTTLFENAEHATRGPARDLFGRLLAERPRDRRIVVCTREPLRLHLSRFVPPHQILTLRAADLAFDPEEVRRALGARPVATAQLERIVRVSRGWPIAVLLFARFAGENRLDALLDRLDASDYDDLHEYVVDQVLEAMPLPLREALLFCSVVSDAAHGDIEVALGEESADALDRAARESPFVRMRDHTYEVHPLAASTLRTASPDRAHDIVRSGAARYASRGDVRNAARLFLAAGDAEAAAAELDRTDTIYEFDLARMTTAVPNDVRRRFPAVWAVAVTLRLWQSAVEETRSEAEVVWNACGADTPPSTRLFVGYARSLYEQYVGHFGAALALLDTLDATIAGWAVAAGDAAEQGRKDRMIAYFHYFRGLVLARGGALREAERELGAPHFAATPPIVSGLHLIAGADIARTRGERALERREIDEARAIVAAVGLGNYVARCTAEAVIGAWLAGEDDVVAHLAADLDELVERDGVFALGFLTAMLRGREREPRAADLLIYVCFGHLIAAARTEDRVARQRLLAKAHAVAERFSAPYPLVLTSLARAVDAQGQVRAALFERARDAASRIDDAPNLAAAVDDAARGGPGGFLAPFLRRYRAEDAGSDAIAEVRVRFADGRVLNGGAEVKLGRVPEAILFALAEDPRGVSVTTLLERFWGDVDADAARNALKVTIWRVRKALGAITIRADDGVRLTGVTVDLWDAQRAYRSALDARDVARRETLLREALALLTGERPAFFAQWEWFDPIARRINEKRAEIAALLARIALDHGRADDARQLGESIAAYDPLDEAGAEIIVRAHLARGDRAEALRWYRRYRSVLRSELDCEPSPGLTRLVHGRPA